MAKRKASGLSPLAGGEIVDPAMNALPTLGQITDPAYGLARMKKTIESKKNGANNDGAVKRLSAAAKRGEKRNDSDTLVEQLTESIRQVTVTESGEVATIDIGKEENMAAKKKTTAKKKASNPNTQKGNGMKTAEPIGRGRKMLIRLSDEEYKALQRTSKEKGISMAMVLRSGIK